MISINNPRINILHLFNRIWRRFPNRNQSWKVFLAGLLPVNLWALIIYLREFPSYILRMDLWDSIGIYAYTQAVIFLDAAMLWLVITVLALLLPSKYLAHNFEISGSILALGISGGVVSFHYTEKIDQLSPWLNQFPITWLWLGFFLIFCIILLWAIPRFHKLQVGLTAFLERWFLLSTVYLTLNVMMILVLFLRTIKIY